MITERFTMFFLEQNNGIEFIHETNTKALYTIITNSKNLELFWIYSINEYSDSPTSIAELIITCIRRGIVFQAEQEDLYFDKTDQIQEVYPKIFDIFKKQIRSQKSIKYHK